MPNMNGIEATRVITTTLDPAPRVIVLTTFDLDEYVYDALSAGASGFLLKDVTAETLFEAVRVVARGDALLTPNVDAPPDRRVRPDPAASPCRPGERVDRPRDRRVALDRRRAVERRDRRRAVREQRDGQDPRQPHPRQARRARPHPGRDRRLRVRDRPARTREAHRSARHVPAHRVTRSSELLRRPCRCAGVWVTVARNLTRRDHDDRKRPFRNDHHKRWRCPERPQWPVPGRRQDGDRESGVGRSRGDREAGGQGRDDRGQRADLRRRPHGQGSVRPVGNADPPGAESPE